MCDFIESLVENESIIAIIDPLHHEVGIYYDNMI